MGVATVTKRNEGDTKPVGLPNTSKVAQTAKNPAPPRSPANDHQTPKATRNADRKTYWTSDKGGWTLIVNGDKRARVEGSKVVILTHGDSKPRRVTAPDSKEPFAVAERLLGIPKVDRFEDRGLRINITSPRTLRERATGEFCEKVPKEKELRHYLSEAWKQLNNKATEDGLSVNGSAARDQIGRAIRTLQVSGDKWSPATLTHIESAVENLHEAKDDPLAPYQLSALIECQKAVSLIELDPELPRVPETGPDSLSPRPMPRWE